MVTLESRANVAKDYKRTVLIILPETNTDDLCYRAEGLNYAFSKLKESTSIPPTSGDRAWAQRVLSKPYELNTLHIHTLIEYALKWKDIGIWTSAIKCPHGSLQNLNNDSLLQARKIFDFQNISLR